MGDGDDSPSLADARSWALHEEVAARLLTQPELIVRARERVDGWTLRSAEHPYASAWSELLKMTPEKLKGALSDKGDRMCTLR